MTLLYSSPRFLDHETGKHPERPERLVRVHRHLERTGLDTVCRRVEWQPARADQLARVHDRAYLATLERFVGGSGRRLEVDTVVSRDSFAVAQLAAGAAVDAVARVIRGEQRNALCLIRPPGHHALRDGAMGFCLLNNVAVAAQTAVDEFQLDRVLIVDFDVHHGNGTQDAFWTDGRVGYLSVHRWPFYPGTGREDETGSAAGLGTTRNLPLEMGIDRADFRGQFRAELEDFAARVRPQLVLVSAGFDAHREDPVGSLGLETEDFGDLTRDVLAVADATADGKLVSLLEGGYNTAVLPACVEEHLRELLAASGVAVPARQEWPPSEPPT